MPPENYFPTRHTHTHQLDRPDWVRAYRPVEASNIDDEPKLCFDPVNVSWVRHLVGSLHDLTDLRIWRGTDSEKRHAVQQIEKFLSSLKECEVCEDCEPEQPETPSGGSGGCYSPVGQLGLTLEELEQYIMGCLDISNSIRWNPTTGMIEVRSCDGWVPISGMTAPLLNSGNTPPTDFSFDEWDGMDAPPPIPDSPSIPHTNPAYVTADSVKCAKATAILVMIQRQYDGLVNAYALGVVGTLSIPAIVAELTVYYATAGTAAIIRVATIIVGGLAGISLANEIAAIEAMQEIELGPAICALSPHMSEGTQVTDKDIDNAVSAFDLIKEPTDFSRGVFGAFPMWYLKSEAQQLVPTTECGCGLYLPYGYEPPIETFHFTHHSFGSDNSAANASYEFNNSTPFNSVYGLATQNIGEVAGNMARSEFYGEQALIQHDKLSWIVELSEPATITQVEFSYSLQGYCEGAGVHVDCFDATQNKWVHLGSVGGNAPVPGTREFNGNLANVTHVLIQGWWQGQYNTGNRCIATATALKLSGNVGGTPFVDLPIDTGL
jgi:hypothetical protein